MSTLSDFQQRLKSDIYAAWAEPNIYNVMAVSPTGSGKTVLFCAIIKELGIPTCVISHRQELVSQSSLSLNRERVPHAIIAPKAIIQEIIALHHNTHGYSCYSYRADVRVAGVDTLIRRDTTDSWFTGVQLLIQDEGHHELVANKWGAAHKLFPMARGLSVTAHAIRADGRGLGRHADGLVDRLVVGPSCRDLIRQGYLTDYRLLIPPNDIQLDESDISPGTGDYSQGKLRAATHKSNTLVGDVVKHYLASAEGKLGVTFAVDVESAKEIATRYNAHGVPAQVITADTPIGIRAQFMRQFRNRQILQLVSVDCLGEGTDVPAIECVSMARKTASWQLMCQQIGRGLRAMVDDDAAFRMLDEAGRLAAIAASRKPKALIFDHVGNIMYHYEQRGMFDAPQEYTLDRREPRSRKKSGLIPMRTCVNCTQPYERIYTTCPHCGFLWEPSGRGSPEAVEGNLFELDAAVLAQMRGEVAKIDGPCYSSSNDIQGASIRKSHRLRQEAQVSLRAAMALWGGWRSHVGEDDATAQRRFFHTFGVDVLSAQAYGKPYAEALESRVRNDLQLNNVVEA